MMTERRATADPLLTISGLLWSMATVWYLLCEALTASVFAGYNYATFYISDLGVPEHADFEGRPLASEIPQLMNAGFIGSGLLFLLGLVVLAPRLVEGRRRVPLLLVGALYAAGITLVGLVPGSPSNADNGLMAFHVAGAITAIAGGNTVAILSAGPLRFLEPVRRIGPVLGIAGLVSAALLVGHVLLPDGVWERGAVYTFMLWQLLVGILLVRRANTHSPERAGSTVAA